MGMTIIYTVHVLKDKIPLLNNRGFRININDIEEVVNHPEHLDKISDHPNIIASKKIDKKHVLRVVYVVDNDTIRVITCYPAEIGRYY